MKKIVVLATAATLTAMVAMPGMAEQKPKKETCAVRAMKERVDEEKTKKPHEKCFENDSQACEIKAWRDLYQEE
ncbi:MAG: hypothetical protein AB1810_03880 [Pseudomonadota bacterium]